MKLLFQVLTCVAVAAIVAGCTGKKKSEDIIVATVESPKPQPPIRMQDYLQMKDIVWLGKKYQVEIHRAPDDSLKMVKNEEGQKFVDNRISIRVIRSDGSVFFNRSFTKGFFDKCLNDDYRNTGILEGLVFDRVDANNLLFAASVSHPQTDEYIPMILTLSNFGDVDIRLDSDMDTSGSNEEE